MKKNLSRRNFLRTGALTAAGAVLAGCGATPTPEVIEKVVKETVEVEKEVIKEVEKEVVKTVEVKLKKRLRKLLQLRRRRRHA